MEEHPKLQWHVLPPCSPNLNNTERLWKWLKDTVILNQYLPGLEAIQQAIDDFIAWLPTVPDAIESRLWSVTGLIRNSHGVLLYITEYRAPVQHH